MCYCIRRDEQARAPAEAEVEAQPSEKVEAPPNYALYDPETGGEI